MTEIKPKMVDGEPVCSGWDCPLFGDIDHRFTCDMLNYPCIPGLRQQRDEARYAVCWLGGDNHDQFWQTVAVDSGWKYLLDIDITVLEGGE